ncbi:hypothetical protein K449DRAFT_434114 [Hypoxylon sp. EC38]|nr:hypothetical protein K449DRAFT_434114 [Hypoxylon sp. EC38]
MAYLNPYNDITLNGATGYDFITELSPGVWKICRKRDRIEYLAHDVTDQLYTDPKKPENLTDLGFLINSEQHPIANRLGRILNHENLVNLIETISVMKSSPGSPLERRTYAVWDFCDAGNLGNLLVRQQIIKSEFDPFTDEEWEDYKDPEETEDEESDEEERYDRWSPPGSFRGPDDDDIDDSKIDNGDIDDGDTDDVDTNDVDADDGDADANDDGDHEIQKGSGFLPESFCWHVLVSVLKALAWLHNGSRDVELIDGQPMMLPNADWEPMLHRNITPANIFLMHPRRDEWYGKCKLGNYGRLFISNHNNGSVEESSRPRNNGRALAPPRNKDFQPLEELIQLHKKYDHSFPQQPDQPYTIVSEWRALGEIMQAMMKDTLNKNRLAEIRLQSVMENLRHLDYSSLLKNVVVMLMTINPDQKAADGTYIWTEYQRHNLTTQICAEAVEGWWKWRASNNPEARKLVVEETPMARQVEDDLLDAFAEKDATTAKNNVPRKQDKWFNRKQRPLMSDPHQRL